MKSTLARFRRGLCIVFAAAALAAPAHADNPEPKDKPHVMEVTGHIYHPQKLEPTQEHVRNLKVPDGFTVSKFAEGLGNTRMLATAPDGAVYVTRRLNGDCVLLRDTDGDGKADVVQVVAERPDMHGIALHGDKVYLTTVKEVFVADRKSDGTFGEMTRIIHDLPDGGQHPNRTLAVGPDGKLYISVGSDCNECEETNPEHATILRASLDGKSRMIFAKGLRNTIGFDWHPQTGEMWGMDHGIDWLGDEAQREELNHLQEGKNYGWPYFFEDNKPSPTRTPPGGISVEEWAKKCEGSVMGYTPHAAPMQLAFYTGTQFPKEYQGDAFEAMRGSWNRQPPSGYEVIRIHFEQGKPVSIEPFLTGFLVKMSHGYGQFARLAGCAVAADGSLLVADDSNGVIYRVAYGQRPVAAK